MIPIVFAAFLVFSMTVALVDWRRGWLLAIVCGVLQDPARKLTPGTPVVMTLSIMVVYAAIVLAAQGTLQANMRELAQRFEKVQVAFALLFLALILAAVNGLATFGLENWKAPALALFVYCAPLPAVAMGYSYLQREEQMYRFFTIYAVITCFALIGTPLEYFNLNWRALGTVALNDVNLRFLPGLQIRMLSGFYRAPDIMGWHAATLSMIGIAMALRARQFYRAWPWILVAAWGFLNCIISGRRKVVYMVLVFVAAFLFRYLRKLTVPQVVALAFLGVSTLLLIRRIGSTEESSVYTQGAYTNREEVFARLEGGLLGTIEQSGIMGAGLGTATQGVYHVLSPSAVAKVGWQEGGLGKLAMELGVPGLLAAGFFGLTLLVLMMKISGHPDVPGSSQLLRATLFGMVIANMVEFMVSAQAYSDALLTLMTAFLVGCLLATAALDERLAETLARAPVPLSIPRTRAS